MSNDDGENARPSGTLTAHSTKQVIRLNNVNCPYCGQILGAGTSSDKDHVIGRRFVPRGTLHGCWNLLLNSCRDCNAFKADLEDDISAITMLPDPTGRFACDDERLHAEAVRKARSSRSRQTKKPVAESQGQMTIRGRFGPMIMTFNMVSLPQIEEHRLFDLARRQLQAIFFFQTYDHIKQRGGFWQGSFTPVAVAHKGDWGRSRLEWFETHTKDWDLRWASNGADGFHQVWIRKFDEVTPLWAWAMEWNRNYRLVGFFGDEDQLQRQIDQVPHEDVSVLNGDEGTMLATRREVPLAEGEDTLFDCFD